MLIAWATVGNQADAERLAAAAVDLRLAVCVQIDGPVTSVYGWDNRLQQEKEYRLTFKLLPAQLPGLQQHVLAHHPYDTPEWIVVRAEAVGEKYLSWAQANSTNLPL